MGLASLPSSQRNAAISSSFIAQHPAHHQGTHGNRGYVSACRMAVLSARSRFWPWLSPAATIKQRCPPKSAGSRSGHPVTTSWKEGQQRRDHVYAVRAAWSLSPCTATWLEPDKASSSLHGPHQRRRRRGHARVTATPPEIERLTRARIRRRPDREAIG